MRSPGSMASEPWLYLAFGIAAAILVASHTPVGAALSMDSLFYLSTASNILEGNGIAYNTYALSGPAVQATTLWPPLYPVVLAGVTWLADLADTSDVVGIAVFNFLALIASLYLILRIASLTGPTWAGFLVAVVFMISPSIQIVFTYAWSEVLFIPLSLAAYLSLQRYLVGESGDTRSGLFSMVVLLGLATYSRYVGLAFFAAAAVALLFHGRGSVTERLRTTAVAAFAYLAVLAPMLIRNLLASGSLSGGDRGTTGTNLLSDSALLLRYLYLEFLNLPYLLAAVVIVFAAVATAWLLLRQFATETQSDQTFDLPNVTVPFLFASCYLVFLLISRSRQSIDLDSRMLSVAIPFLLIGLLGVYRQLSIRTRAGLAALPFLLPLTAFAVNAVDTHSNIINGWRELGEPGFVLGKTYPSMTGHQMKPLRDIREYFAPGAGDLILTDISRPAIVDHLFRGSDVRQIAGKPNEQNVAALETMLQRTGLAIISDTAWLQVLAKHLEGRADFFNIEASTGGLAYVVIKLPVEEP